MSTSYSYTGSVQTHDVSGLTTIGVELYGAGGSAGEDAENPGGSGGSGGYVEGEIDVSDFSQIDIYAAGGNGSVWGWYNGGRGTTGEDGYGCEGGDGAGATAIVSGTGVALLVAEGGGGGGGGLNESGDTYYLGGGGGGGARGGKGAPYGGGGNDGSGTGNGGDGGAGAGSLYSSGDPGQNGGYEIISSSYISNGSGNSQDGYSGNGEIIVTELPPDAPSNLAISADGDTSFSLSWDITAEEYDIYRSTEPGVGTTDTHLGTTTNKSYTDTGLTNGKTYYYRITATNPSGTSDLSNEVSATTTLYAPTIDTVVAGNREVSLQWSINDDNPAGGVNIFRDGNEIDSTTDVGVTSYTDNSLLDGKPYSYSVERDTGDATESSGSKSDITDLPPVENLTVVSVDGRYATLSWTDPSNNAYGQRVLLKKPSDGSYTQDNQSFDDDYPEWTVNYGGRATDYVWEGSYSFHSSANGTGMQASRTYFPGGEQPTAFTYYWRETSGSTGGGVRLKNSNGNYELGMATDNAEWDVDDGNGITDSLASNAEMNQTYAAWRRFTVFFDWSNGTYGIDFEDLSGGVRYRESGRPLKQGVDIEAVELWNYNGGSWGSSGHNMWWDGIYFAGSIPYTTTELLDGQQYDATVETFTPDATAREDQ